MYVSQLYPSALYWICVLCGTMAEVWWLSAFDVVKKLSSRVFQNWCVFNQRYPHRNKCTPQGCRFGCLSPLTGTKLGFMSALHSANNYSISNIFLFIWRAYLLTNQRPPWCPYMSVLPVHIILCLDDCHRLLLDMGQQELIILFFV